MYLNIWFNNNNIFHSQPQRISLSKRNFLTFSTINSGFASSPSFDSVGWFVSSTSLPPWHGERKRKKMFVHKFFSLLRLHSVLMTAPTKFFSLLRICIIWLTSPQKILANYAFSSSPSSALYESNGKNQNNKVKFTLLKPIDKWYEKTKYKKKRNMQPKDEENRRKYLGEVS